MGRLPGFLTPLAAGFAAAAAARTLALEAPLRVRAKAFAPLLAAAFAFAFACDAAPATSAAALATASASSSRRSEDMIASPTVRARSAVAMTMSRSMDSWTLAGSATWARTSGVVFDARRRCFFCSVRRCLAPWSQRFTREVVMMAFVLPALVTGRFLAFGAGVLSGAPSLPPPRMLPAAPVRRVDGIGEN